MAIDQVWLESLRCDTVGGARVTGLAGLGTEKVVLAVTMADGTKAVCSSPRTQIGFHISEVPPILVDRPEYDLSAVNRKLLALLGNPRFDSYSLWLNRLHAKMVRIVADHGVTGLMMSNMQQDSIESIPFALATPGMRRRLTEIDEWPVDPAVSSSRIPSVNGEEYPVFAVVLEDGVAWARKALIASEELAGPIAWASPSTLHANPLVVWGAAAMEGFFTDEELPAVATFIEENVGDLIARDDCEVPLAQAQMVANLLAHYRPDVPVERMVRLCAACRFRFDVRDAQGVLMADGIRY